LTTTRSKVLLVDDIEANLVALDALLGSLDCELIRASSGNEALRLLLKHEFAVMLLDVQMPEMDGYEVARYAHDNPQTREVPIIFVTAMHETRDSVVSGYDAGAFDVLFKPIDPYVLRSKVQVFLDLHTSRRQLREEIEAHRHTLAEVEAFNYSVSHDLRAPLRPLDGFADALLEEYGDKLDDAGKDYLRRIRAAALRMGQLIEDLLQLSRMSRADVRRGQVDVTALVEAIVDELRAGDPDRKVEVVAAPDVKIDADPRLLRIAMENLLRNAWKFTRTRSDARIEIGYRPAGLSEAQHAVLFVTDNGVGFDPAYAGKLFRAFQRLHAASSFEGTGIGLAIVDRIVRRHGGRIWAESVPDRGATFSFTLGTG
jgi:two-component system, sensor histidine kinase and response regulator